MGNKNGLERLRAIQRVHHADVEVPDFPRIQKVTRLLSSQPPEKMLDVGYAKGSFADSLIERGWKCTGLDLNPPESAGIRVIQCDLNQGFPVQSEAFDLVTAGEVIEHMFDEGMFLQECHRVLKKRGTLILTTPNLAFLVNRLLLVIGRSPLFVTAPYHYHFHTLRTLRELVEGSEFRVERVLSSHVLYSRRRHWSGWLFEQLGDLFPTLGAHLILIARRA